MVPPAAVPDDGDALLFESGDSFEDDVDDLLVPPLPLLLPPDEPNRFAYWAALDEVVSSLPFDDDLCFLLAGSDVAAADDDGAAVAGPPLIFGLPISCCCCCAVIAEAAGPPSDAEPDRCAVPSWLLFTLPTSVPMPPPPPTMKPPPRSSLRRKSSAGLRKTCVLRSELEYGPVVCSDRSYA